jgi:amino acid permease
VKVKWKHGDRSVEFERQPMPPERFNALCKLAGAAIGGGVLLVAVRMVGIWAIVWAVGALVLVGLYRLIRGGIFD